MRRLRVLGLLGAVAAGCGGGASDETASMNRYEAIQELGGIMSRVVRDPQGSLYRHHLRLVRLYRGRNSDGDAAWIGVVRDRSLARRICFAVWKHNLVVGVAYNSEVVACAPPGRVRV